MLACVFDTETTGLWDFSLPASSEKQPDVVQLCAMLADDERVYSAINLFIHSDTPIEPKAFETHRIDRAMTERVGVSRLRACQLLDSFARQADIMVGHNVEFDQKIMLAANIRSGGAGQILKDKPYFCTMKSSTELCKIPNPRRPSGYKWPSLIEAYKILVDPAGFEGAHDAMADARASYEVYRVLRRQSN